MADIVSPEVRSKIMSRIRGKDTKPELAVRSYLHRLGLRFRLHSRRLPGSPDLVFPKHRCVVFVHGCFWHQHEGCTHAGVPASNRSYWVPKLKRTIERDIEAQSALKKEGWQVEVIWECEIDDERLTDLAERIRRD